jgi:NosR/NirI family nitrous oxide reductase transcriptional regulator
VNEAFAAHEDPRATERPSPNRPRTVFIDMQMALVSVPAIGKAVLGDADTAIWNNGWKPGDSAILIAGLGQYSFKGSGYVRGGIFDRIQLIQDDISVRFRDRQHRRATIAPRARPASPRSTCSRSPPIAALIRPSRFRLQLLIHREVGPIEKLFITRDLDYALPQSYLRALPAPRPNRRPRPWPPPSRPPDRRGQRAGRAVETHLGGQEAAGRTVLAMLGVLTRPFSFRNISAGRNARSTGSACPS